VKKLSLLNALAAIRFFMLQKVKQHMKELIEMKKKFLGNTQISPLCKKCSDEYRVLHFKEV
jgi:hypothetical protein